MEQKFFHYTLWEDFQNGMYNEDKVGRKERIQKAIFLLTTPYICYEQMKRVTKEWKYATLQNLTNPAMNHQAFLGQSACSIYAGIHEDETREAWGFLTNMQRYKANKIADKVYAEWKADYEKESNSFFQLSFSDLMEEQ